MLSVKLITLSTWHYESLCEVLILENTISYKSRKYATRAVNMYKYLTKEKREFVLSKQFVRAATSIGANIAESECAISEKDFLSKIYIALKECNETIYWLGVLFDGEFITEKQYLSMKRDCVEMKRMMTATTKTICNRRKNKFS